MVELYYLVPGRVISMFKLKFINWSTLVLSAHSQKSSRICDQLIVNFEPC